MSSADRWATVLYVIVLVLLLAVGGLEYRQYQDRTSVETLARKEKDLKAKEEALRKRAAAAENLKPMIAQFESQLLKVDQGNYYAQLLLDGVGNKRLSGVQFPQYQFAESGSVGKFPRYAIAGSATGSESQVLAFIRLFEEGPYKVQVPNINFSLVGGQASASLTLVYTAEQVTAPKPAEKK
ncbi:MAG TPA: hypothetical protein VD973_02190 [Symbiobacteriaceae bacterium]|nr:hypothetical protein [Symbiobacteriaceae bacterium]